MKLDGLSFFVLGMCTGVFVFMIIIGIFGAAPNQQYKQGQIDALTGKVKFKLVEHGDGTKTWESISYQEVK